MYTVLRECDENQDDSQLLTLINSAEFCGGISNGVELVDDNHERDGYRVLTFEAKTVVDVETGFGFVKEDCKHRFELKVMSYQSLRTIAYLVAIVVNEIEGNVFANRRYAAT